MEVVAEEVIEIKKEIVEEKEFLGRNRTVTPAKFIDVRSTSSDSDSSDTDDSDTEGSGRKKRKLECVLPVGFLDPLPPQERAVFLRKRKITNSPTPRVESKAVVACSSAAVQSCKQFWKAGDYGGENVNDSAAYFGGIDHVRVHPKFLHSNATSHKWALGAFAELLDNALDEVCNGATYVHVDVLENRQDTNKMLLVEDNGGGMTPEKMRHCMSLGYSSKSKMANTIGQYGNGFKTSTMRLGADVIVFSRCQGADGRSVTQSIGMLSYTFLRRTGKEDIVVPMIDYERRGQDWNKLMRSSNNDWNRNLETILQWSPYSTEEDLLQQFNSLKHQGTRIIIYNLWEDDEGRLELDFDVDPDDIQIRESNRDEKKIEMATKYPNSRHFLTYRHSLRSYASILYLRIPSGFRIILRGKDDVHHNLVNDMMLKEERTYKPVGTDKTSKDLNMMAIVAIGFVKDAKYHIDIQGFNVYHKNRLIKPFWRVWNAAGSDGRGVIGVLEADFVEPAHDKQGFERTTALSRLEQRLIVFQKQYWGQNCHKIGYARRRRLKKSVSPDRENTSNVLSGNSNSKGRSSNKGGFKLKSSKRNENAVPAEDAIQDEIRSASHERPAERSHQKALFSEKLVTDINGDKRAHADSTPENTVKLEAKRVKRERLENDGLMVDNLMWELQMERAWSSSLEIKLMEAQNKIQAMDKEQEALVDIFSEERSRRDAEEESLRNRLKVASDTINDLFDKVKLLESKSMVSCKNERSNG